LTGRGNALFDLIQTLLELINVNLHIVYPL